VQEFIAGKPYLYEAEKQKSRDTFSVLRLFLKNTEFNLAARVLIPAYLSSW